MVHASAIPGIHDIGGLALYVVSNPYLFLSSTTWMTTALLLGAVVVRVLPRRTPILYRVAPTLAVILTYFGLGSFALSLEILIRFHSAIPYETEVQFVSGIGHLLEAAIGIGVLIPHLRRHSRADWLWAHNVALLYWTFQVAVLTPPWFAFQGQRALVTTVALLVFAVAAMVNVVLWRRASERDRPR